MKTVWIRVNKYTSSPYLYRMINSKFEKENNENKEVASIYQSLIPTESY